MNFSEFSLFLLSGKTRLLTLAFLHSKKQALPVPLEISL
jgi:hypothetical protein